MRALLSFTALTISFAASAAGIPVTLVDNPSPQFNGSTCQSYSLAILMAATGDPAFMAPSRKELRENELTIRTEIENQARKEFGSNANCSDIRKCVTHSHWEKAISALTNNTRRLRSQSIEFNEVPKWVAEKTGVGVSMAIPSVQTSIAKPVMMSFTKVKDSNYFNAQGEGSHIVTLFGSSRSTSTVSSSDSYQLLMLNSAIKDGSGKFINMCETTPISTGDLKYSAGVSWIKDSDFAVKLYGGKAKIMWVE